MELVFQAFFRGVGDHSRTDATMMMDAEDKRREKIQYELVGPSNRRSMSKNCATFSLCCCAAVLLCCCAAVLLCCCAAVLLCCCAA
jgi:hypothetical protein